MSDNDYLLLIVSFVWNSVLVAWKDVTQLSIDDNTNSLSFSRMHHRPSLAKHFFSLLSLDRQSCLFFIPSASYTATCSVCLSVHLHFFGFFLVCRRQRGMAEWWSPSAPWLHQAFSSEGRRRSECTVDVTKVSIDQRGRTLFVAVRIELSQIFYTMDAISKWVIRLPTKMLPTNRPTSKINRISWRRNFSRPSFCERHQN